MVLTIREPEAVSPVVVIDSAVVRASMCRVWGSGQGLDFPLSPVNDTSSRAGKELVGSL